jgi:hypothetical protein
MFMMHTSSEKRKTLFAVTFCSWLVEIVLSEMLIRNAALKSKEKLLFAVSVGPWIMDVPRFP